MASQDGTTGRQPGPDTSSFMPLGDLRTYVQIVKRRKWSLIFVLVITMAAAAFFTYRQTPLYQSSATVLVKPLSPSQILQGNNYNFSVSMQTEETLMTSPDVERAATVEAQAQGQSGSVSVHADSPPDTTFLTVTASSPDPLRSQVWANAYATAYTNYRRDQALNLYKSAEGGFETKLTEIRGQIA